MFLYSNIIGAMFLVTEGMLAWIAFAGYDNPCTIEDVPKDQKDNYHDGFTFPCGVSALYNQNFLKIPVLG